MPKVKDDNKIVAIHEAAMKLVIKTGFAGLKMADVATHAGVATGTLYVYYTSKEELINTVYVETKREIVKVILNPEYQADTFFKSFKNMWLGYFEFCMNQPEKMLFVEQFLYSGFISEQNITMTENLLKPLNLFLENAQNNGIIKQASIEILKAQMQGSLHEIVKVLIRDQYKPSPEETSQYFQMAWDAIRC
jgi:AcrR family transcriptional regulator